MKNPLECVRRILELRGISAAELDAFLKPALDRLADASALPQIDLATDVILGAVAAGKPIVIFGDYDCDGVCATAILSRTLKTLGAKVSEFIPKRIEEGYGMTDAALRRMLKDNPEVKLVITVDNGINSVEQVAELAAKGIEVVITDHHLPGEVLPKASALVNPKVASPKEFEDLCGAGVAFLLARRLVDEARQRKLYDGGPVAGPLLILAGLATVTDVMPVLGQNRILVAEALKRFFTCAPMGLKELYMRAARNGSNTLSTKDFGFLLGPRMNAAGRVASGMEALELILSEDREIARELARIIDGYNLERKSIEQKMLEEALSKVVEGAAAQVIDLPTGHPGVAGIVAARVMEKLGSKVPVCVYASGHGSGRAPEGFNLRDAFVACGAVLERFGGHAAAGGFAVKSGKIDEFRKLFCEYCEQNASGLSVADETAPDLWLEAGEVTLELADALRQLEPFGEANPEPRFGLKGVLVSDVRLLGNEGKHLSFSLSANGQRFRAVWWGHGSDIERFRSAANLPRNVIFALDISDYGDRHIELRLVNML